MVCSHMNIDFKKAKPETRLKKRLKKIIVPFVIILLVLATLFCCACNETQQVEGDEDVFSYFIEALRQGEFVEAYSFLSEKIAVDNGEYNSKKNDNAITCKEFQNKYMSIFNLLGIKDIEYSIISDTKSGDTRTIEYKQVYKTELIGDLDASGSVTLLLENDVWKLDWSPSVIFAEMTWGDTVVSSKQNAKRGAIMASGTAVAENVELVTVYSLLTEYDEIDKLLERIIERDKLWEEALKQLSALTDWSEFKQDKRDEWTAKRALKLAEERLQVYMRDYDLFSELCPNELDSISAALEEVIGMERSEFDKKMNHVYGDEGSCTLAQFYPDEITAEQMKKLEKIPSIHVAMENFGSARYYPYGSALSHILGYVGSASRDDIDRLNEGRDVHDGLYTEDSIVGKSGIERLYEEKLRGKDGYLYFIKGKDGLNKRTLYLKEKEDGLDVDLTIDLKLQQYTEKIMDLMIFGKSVTGAVVVMNPKTGAINAIASFPDYNLNSVIRGEEGYYASLLEDERRPLVSKAVDGSYPPGSIFKAFVAAAALDQNVVNENYVFTGTIEDDYWTPTGYGNWIWPAIKRTKVQKRTQPANMTNAMLHSDNIYFADIALKIGEERFAAYVKKLGIGESVPFEFKCGKSQLLSKNSQMDYKLLADSGYGQGEMLISPLQLAAMFCAFQNDGDVPTPYVTKAFYRTVGVEYSAVEENAPAAWIPNAINKTTVSKLLPMLEGVMDPNKNGTGKSLMVQDYVIAGKTGTAELDAMKNRAISWFVGFRAGNIDDDEERLVLVMLDVPYTNQYTSLKFSIARALLDSNEIIDHNG